MTKDWIKQALEIAEATDPAETAMLAALDAEKELRGFLSAKQEELSAARIARDAAIAAAADREVEAVLAGEEPSGIVADRTDAQRKTAEMEVGIRQIEIVIAALEKKASAAFVEAGSARDAHIKAINARRQKVLEVICSELERIFENPIAQIFEALAAVDEAIRKPAHSAHRAAEHRRALSLPHPNGKGNLLYEGKVPLKDADGKPSKRTWRDNPEAVALYDHFVARDKLVRTLFKRFDPLGARDHGIF